MWIVEAVEYFLLPLPTPYKVRCFRVCLRFQLISSKCFRLHKNLTFSASSFCFYILCPMFYEKCFRFRLLKNSNASEFASTSNFFLQSASASTSTKIKPLPLPHPCFKLLCRVYTCRFNNQILNRKLV